MHPLLTHLHPALRATLTAWLISRVGVWLLLLKARGADAPHELIRAASVDMLPSGPLAAALRASMSLTDAPLARWLTGSLGELALLAAVLSVYHMGRRDALPQTAERAAWLFALSPLTASLTGHLPWSVAIAAALIALASAVHARYALGATSALVATLIAPELILLTPGLAWLGWRSRLPGKTPLWAPWLLGISGLTGGVLTIFMGVMMGGQGGVSLRELHTASWRAGVSAPGLAELPWLLGALFCGLCAVRFAQSTPRAWPLLTLPLCIWPLLHADPSPWAPLMLAAAPAFLYLSKLSEEPGLERVLLAISALALAVFTL